MEARALERRKYCGPRKYRVCAGQFRDNDIERCPAQSWVRSSSTSILCHAGVSQYLTEEALDETLTLVQGMAPSSEIVFSFVPPDEALPDDEATLTRQFAQRYATIGEPWLTRPTSDHLRRKLQRMAFAMLEHLSPEAANLRYFQSRQDGLNAPAYEQMMRAMV
jgi:O-methyltransferase involved in polyketide biosynthesis